MWTAHPDEATGLIYAIARDVTELDVAREEAKSEIDSLRSRLKAAEARANEDP